MTLRQAVVWSAIGLRAVSANAQTLNGAAELAFGIGSNLSAGRPESSGSFWQAYTIGLATPLADPKLLRLTADVTLRTGRITFTAPAIEQQGAQRDYGYHLGTVVLPAGRFPLSIQASREQVAESGDYFAANGIRGGLVVPPGLVSPEFRTRSTSLDVGWQVLIPALPRVELGYRRAAATVTGGQAEGRQRNDDLHLNVTRESARVRQSLRYQRTGFESVVSQAFNQQIANLDYDLGIRLSSHLRLSTRVGRRAHDSLFAVPGATTGDPGDPYRPPSDGTASAQYVTSSLVADASRRYAFDLSANLDRQQSSGSSTGARMASGSARLELLPGLVLNGLGLAGQREQIIGNSVITVLTRSGLAGATYRAGTRWLHGSVSASTGAGTTMTPDGRTGSTRSRAGQVTLAAAWNGLTVGGGYDRSENRDDILDYGNLGLDRLRASLTGRVGTFELGGEWERAQIDRGRQETFLSTRQGMASGSITWLLPRALRLTANGGTFRTDARTARDMALFAGAGVEAKLGARLRVQSWLRVGRTVATQARMDQQTIASFAQLEYRIGAIIVTGEYRRNAQQILAGGLGDFTRFRGQQILARVSRAFGVRF